MQIEPHQVTLPQIIEDVDISVKKEVTPQRVSLFKRRRRPRVSDVPPVKSFIRPSPATASAFCVCGVSLFKKGPPKTCSHFTTSKKDFVFPFAAKNDPQSEVFLSSTEESSPKSMLTPAAAAEFPEEKHDDDLKLVSRVIKSEKSFPNSVLTPAAAAEFSKDEHDDNSNMMPEVINSGG